MRRIIFMLLSLTACLPAQTTPQPARITKIVQVNHKQSAQRIGNMASQGHDVVSMGDNALNVVVLSGKADEVAAVEKTIQELDELAPSSSSKDVEVLAYIITGSSEATDSSLSESIVPVVKQLRSIFPYKTYKSLTTVLMRSHDGAYTDNNGVLPLGNPEVFKGINVYSMHYQPHTSPNSRSAIHLENFSFEAKVTMDPNTEPPNRADGIPYATTSRLRQFTATMHADLDLLPGQKVVVGKSNLANQDTALFVVLSARLVD